MKKSNIKNILRNVADLSEMFRQVGESVEKTCASFRNFGLSISGLAICLNWKEVRNDGE